MGGFFDPFLYANGTMIDLNSLLPAGSGWRLTNASAINDAGQIVGQGINPKGEDDAFLLTPAPDPEGAVTFGSSRGNTVATGAR